MLSRHRLNRVVALGLVAFSSTLSSLSLAAEEALPPGATAETGYSSHVNAGEERALPVVLRSIEEAQRQVLVAAYEFTSRPIAQALIAAHQRGVQVYVIADSQENSRGYTQVGALNQAGIPVRLATSYPIFHNKFMVIDGATVETGSFNYTGAAAEKNAENALVLRHVPSLANHYGNMWQRWWNEAQ